MLRPISLSRHAVAITPVGPQEGSFRSPDTCDRGLPHPIAGSAPTLPVSRPARRSLALRPACSRNRLTVLSIRGFGSFVTSTTAPIATGWSESCRVGIAPTEDRRLVTAHNGDRHRPSSEVSLVMHGTAGASPHFFTSRSYRSARTRTYSILVTRSIARMGWLPFLRQGLVLFWGQFNHDRLLGPMLNQCA